MPGDLVTDRTVVNEEEMGLYMRRRTNAYTFNRDLYQLWSQGGVCWIDDDPDDPNFFPPSHPSPVPYKKVKEPKMILEARICK